LSFRLIINYLFVGSSYELRDAESEFPIVVTFLIILQLFGVILFVAAMFILYKRSNRRAVGEANNEESASLSMQQLSI